MSSSNLERLKAWLGEHDLIYQKKDEKQFRDQIRFEDETIDINTSKLEEYLKRFRADGQQFTLNESKSRFVMVKENAFKFQNLHQLLIKTANVQTLAILEALNTSMPIDVCQRHIERMLLPTSSYICDIGAAKNVTSYHFGDMPVMVIENRQSIVELFVEVLLKRIAAYNSTVLHVDKQYLPTLFPILFLVDLLQKSGFNKRMVTVELWSYKPLTRLKTLALHSTPIVTVCEGADIYATIDRILALTEERMTFDKHLDIWVHQSVSNIFFDKFKNRWNSYFSVRIKRSPPMNNICTLEELDLLTPPDSDEISLMGHPPSNKGPIKAHIFSNYTYLISTLNRYAFIRFMSIWCRDVSFAIQFAKTIKNCGQVWINTFHEFHPTVGYFNPVFGNITDYCPFSLPYYCDLEDIKLVNHEVILKQAYVATQKLSEIKLDERMKRASKTIECLADQHMDIDIFVFLTKVFDSMCTIRATDDCHAVMYRTPIGTVVFRDVIPESMPLLLVLSMMAVISGNSVIIGCIAGTDSSAENFISSVLNVHFPLHCIQTINNRNLIPAEVLNMDLVRTEKLSILSKKKWSRMLSKFMDLSCPNCEWLLNLTTRLQTIWYPIGGVSGIEML